MLENNITLRKVQAYTGEKSLTIVLPKNCTTEVGIEKGDFIKVWLKNKQLIMEKATL